MPEHVGLVYNLLSITKLYIFLSLRCVLSVAFFVDKAPPKILRVRNKLFTIGCSRTALLDGQKILNSGVNFTAKTSLIHDRFNKVNYKSWKRIMQSFYQGLILFLSLFQRGLAGQFSVNQENSCSSDRCSSEDRGPCLDDGEKKLYRWDPVKVCQLFNESKHK